MLPTAQSRALVPSAGTLRALVYGLAARAIAHAEESQKDRRTPLAERKKTFESEPPRGLDLGASMGVHGPEPNQLFAAVRSGLFEHRLRTVHGNSRRPEQRSLRPLGRQETGMRNPHVFGEGAVMYYLVGFIIAIAVGLTGSGGGSFTVPALVLLAGLTAGEAVGTAFLFAGVLRLIAAPFYLLKKQIHSRYLWLLLQGAVPGLLVGTWALRFLNRDAGNPVAILVLGVLLAASSSVTFIRRVQNPSFAGKNYRWLPWLALPIGMESGFSSAGAGALGTVLLLNYSEMTPAQVVGTDLLFGLVLALIGSAFHWTFGSISMPILFQLLLGGVPGVVFGCLLAKRVPANKLKTAVALVAIFAGLQLVWTGSRSLASRRATNAAKITAQAGVGHAR